MNLFPKVLLLFVGWSLCLALTAYGLGEWLSSWDPSAITVMPRIDRY